MAAPTLVVPIYRRDAAVAGVTSGAERRTEVDYRARRLAVLRLQE